MSSIYGDCIFNEGFFNKSPEEKERKALANEVRQNVLNFCHDKDLFDITAMMSAGKYISGKDNMIKIGLTITQSLVNAGYGGYDDKGTRSAEQKLKYILSKPNEIAKYLEDNIDGHKFKCEKQNMSALSLTLKIFVD